jgi:hypothetical protein
MGRRGSARPTLKCVALRLGNFVPQNHAALSHSFFFKPRALPEVADRGDLGLAIGGWRLAIGDWRLAIGGWRLVVGDWWLAIGGWRLKRVVGATGF